MMEVVLEVKEKKTQEMGKQENFKVTSPCKCKSKMKAHSEEVFGELKSQVPPPTNFKWTKRKTKRKTNTIPEEMEHARSASNKWRHESSKREAKKICQKLKSQPSFLPEDPQGACTLQVHISTYSPQNLAELPNLNSPSPPLLLSGVHPRFVSEDRQRKQKQRLKIGPDQLPH